MNCISAITSGQYEDARSISHRGPHFRYSPKLQLLRIVGISVAGGQIIRHSGLAAGGQHQMVCHGERTMMVTSNSSLLCARTRIAPCPQPVRSRPWRFEVRRTKSNFVLSSWCQRPLTTGMRLSGKITKTFLNGPLARVVMARDAKRQVA